MDERQLKQQVTRRLYDCRSTLLKEYPFFGSLLLHMNYALAPCGTAYTDMRKIVFDPRFASTLSDEAMQFVLLHELLHCVLRHCTRSKGLQPRRYNIACDIVVNSMILEMWGKPEFYVAGSPAMHQTPNGEEGRNYNAEQIYEMLNQQPDDNLDQLYGLQSVDLHSPWDRIGTSAAEDLWECRIREASKSCGDGSGIPAGLRRYLREVDHAGRINWKQILHNFIQFDRSDYVFEIPDRRYGGDILLPSFHQAVEGARVEKLWFFVDTSGSVTDRAVGEAFLEIRTAIEQIDSLAGQLSFFDTRVTPPVPFESVEDLQKIRPVGGGGTSFYAIFAALRQYCEQEDPPRALLIITDGYSAFPPESEAMDIPVFWIIVNSDQQPPWGEHIHIDTEEEQ